MSRPNATYSCSPHTWCEHIAIRAGVMTANSQPGLAPAWTTAIPELAAVLDPTRPEPTTEQIEQARAELDYARTRRRPPGGEG